MEVSYNLEPIYVTIHPYSPCRPLEFISPNMLQWISWHMHGILIRDWFVYTVLEDISNSYSTLIILEDQGEMG
jgi:hypothetical protein